MVTFFLETMLLAVCAGVSAAVYRQVLAHEPVLNWWFMIGQKYEKRWFFPAIWGCVKCIAGQIALWSYMFLEVIPSVAPGVFGTAYLLYPALHHTSNPAAYFFGMITAICGAILVAMVCARIITNLEKQ